MSKPVKVKEGGNIYGFDKVKKIYIPSGQTSTVWVPEDDVQTDSLYTSENGTYYPEQYGISDADVDVQKDIDTGFLYADTNGTYFASSEGYDGYESVDVNVAGEASFTETVPFVTQEIPMDYERDPNYKYGFETFSTKKYLWVKQRWDGGIEDDYIDYYVFVQCRIDSQLPFYIEKANIPVQYSNQSRYGTETINHTRVQQFVAIEPPEHIAKGRYSFNTEHEFRVRMSFGIIAHNASGSAYPPSVTKNGYIDEVAKYGDPEKYWHKYYSWDSYVFDEKSLPNPERSYLPKGMSVRLCDALFMSNYTSTISGYFTPIQALEIDKDLVAQSGFGNANWTDNMCCYITLFGNDFANEYADAYGWGTYTGGIVGIYEKESGRTYSTGGGGIFGGGTAEGTAYTTASGNGIIRNNTTPKFDSIEDYCEFMAEEGYFR